ncbi:hypothetical protein DOTSEDRAFT_36441 [Dothistroma septosporum NZE10]|uniref:FAD/NAD(P)-binding domain-containing protein n=1 Tax=Dothistroma septosporum (strain NZE10 / CBS 128990) TaxID=675120 RepID=N1PME9_DOTSN|nr:hypothetical protein DOTSEDRAFT_36441 [Dothistroma septosporum NZE10]
MLDLPRITDFEILKGLKKASFRCDGGPDDSDLLIKYLQHRGGYYINVDASKMITDGKINKVKHGQEVAEITAHGLDFAAGTSLQADEIISATGYSNTRSQARVTFGDEVADRVRVVWGVDRKGLALQIEGVETDIGAHEAGEHNVKEWILEPSDDELLRLCYHAREIVLSPWQDRVHRAQVALCFVPLVLCSIAYLLHALRDTFHHLCHLRWSRAVGAVGAVSVAGETIVILLEADVARMLIASAATSFGLIVFSSAKVQNDLRVRSDDTG